MPTDLYQLGEPLRWKRCRDDSIRPWTVFTEGPDARTLNLGDPSVRDLITRDVLQFDVDPRIHPRPCGTCGQTLEGAAVEIRDGRIRRAWIYHPAEFDNTAIDYLILPDGRLQAMPEWNNYPVAMVANC